jgi:hypothetical protein
LRIPYDAAAPLGREFIALAPEVVAAILLTLVAGWQRAADFSDVNPQAGEVLMTERLRDGMRGALKGHLWGKMLIVLPGTESRSGRGVVLPDGRTDIPLMLIEVFLRTQEHDPHAIIECKRIAGSDTHLCREYVVEGIDRFVTGKYGENHALGFMVGYVLSGTAAESAEGINAYLTRASRQGDHLAPANVCDGAPSWESQHARPRPSSQIRLHHAFLRLAHSMA